jgi:hypothetical protein
VSQTDPTTSTLIRLAALIDRPITASQDSLADVLGVSCRTVARALGELETAGTIRRERRCDAAGHRLPDRIVPTGQPLSSGSQSKSTVPWTPEVTALRDAMLTAGIRVGWGRLRPDVIADLTRWVRTIGIARLVREASGRIWGRVRHVAAFLRFWRELRPERRPTCPFHPAESIDRGRACPACAEHRALSVPMPDDLRGLFRRRRALLLSA